MNKIWMFMYRNEPIVSSRLLGPKNKGGEEKDSVSVESLLEKLYRMKRNILKLSLTSVLTIAYV